ncbi:hypothetical protein GCM10027053_25430 [Intrasporangium mesophilum]
MVGLGVFQAADLMVGLVVLAAGLASLRFGRVSWLMLLVAATWFLGSVLAGAVFLHRGPLVHLHLTYPTGRVRRRYVTVVVAAAYVLAVVEAFAPSPLLMLGLSLLVAAAAIDVFVRTTGPARKAGRPALGAALAFSAVLVLSALNQELAWDADEFVLLVYDVVVASAVIVLACDLRWGRWTESTLSDLVADLGATSDTSGLAGRLQRALGDPHVTVGYWLPERAAYVDGAGSTVELPGESSDLAATYIDDEGQPIAVIVHDRSLLEDPRLIGGATTAARLAVTNARMLAEISSRVGELTESRQRIVDAVSHERARIADELASGAQRRLAEVSELLERLSEDGLERDPNLARLREEITRAQEDLRTFVADVRPAALAAGGLATAVREMAGHLPFPVDVRVEPDRLPDALESALLFVCSEGITNVVKHARATRCSVVVTTEAGVVTAVIVDDGVGGADPAGSGLLGLADRIETMGGRLLVTSRPEGGTRLEASIPQAGALGPVALLPEATA